MTAFSAQNIMIWVAVGGLFGWIADAAFKTKRISTAANIAVGIVGAFLGTWFLDRYAHWVDLGNPFINQVVTAFLGATILLVLVAAFERATD